MAPLVLIEDAHEHWRILGPVPSFGEKPYMASNEDRRYRELCVVKGSLAEALRLLHRLEAGS